jgi:hypothetical protein
MDVDNPGKPFPLPVPRSRHSGNSPFVFGIQRPTIHGQRLRDGVQDIHIALEGVVEPRCVDQYDWTTVHCELFRSLGFLRARPEVSADVKFGLACKVDELD